MVSTMMDYAINIAHVHIDALGPMNEPDNPGDPVQGPQVGATQYVRMLDTLETQLQGYGLGNIPLVGPDNAIDKQRREFLCPGHAGRFVLDAPCDAIRLPHLRKHVLPTPPSPTIPPIRGGRLCPTSTTAPITTRTMASGPRPRNCGPRRMGVFKT